jgi:hypothetical protein
VPQRDQRPRPIMDYSYYDTNKGFLPIAPNRAMQFGTALPRLLQHLAYCHPSFGPPLLAKLDLADGYYRVPLSSTAALQLAVVLPTDVGSENLIALTPEPAYGMESKSALLLCIHRDSGRHG